VPVWLGSEALKDRVLEARPQLTVTGHNHEGYGRWDKGWGSIANVSYLTDRYRAGEHPIQEFWLEPRG
jgi:Icc-related predicted phosphoesterase